MQPNEVEAKPVEGTTGDEQEEHRYLLFSLNNEIYGTPLLGVREIIEPQKTKFIPNTRPYFLGVVNVRGQVIGVFDLRKKFNIPANNHERNALIVFESEGGNPLAALVDRVDAVTIIKPSDIEDPHVTSEVPSGFLIGVGKWNDKLVNLIDLKTLLSRDELIESSRATLTA